MSIPFFKDVLKALGKSLNYKAVVNLYGNSFVKDADKVIQQANPLRSDNQNAMQGLHDLFANVKMTPQSQMTDIDWATD